MMINTNLHSTAGFPFKFIANPIEQRFVEDRKKKDLCCQLPLIDNYLCN